MNRFIYIILILVVSSCSVTNYYQVYKTEVEKGTVFKNKITFEDESCIVYYNLWSNGGDVGFSVFNKTATDLKIDLTKTFFVLNGVANEYFQNRTFSKSSYVTYAEKPMLTIPSKTLINISEYFVTNKRLFSCDLIKYPTKKNIKTLNFNKDNSPYVFCNLITYYSLSDTTRLENKFYVSEVTNYPSSEMYINVDTSFCGNKLDFPQKDLKKYSAEYFYIKYIKE
jgi:hypothetical protein